MRAHHAAAQHGHARGRHARHPAHQEAVAACGLAQRKGRGLDGQAARHFTHRREQRQAAALIGHRLVGDRGATGFEQAVRLFRVGREVQVGEQDLALAQHLPFGRLRLLHLHHQVGIEEHFGRIGDDARAGRFVSRIARADARAGARLHHHLVPMRHVLAHGHRREADAMLLDLDFFGNAHAHDSLRTGFDLHSLEIGGLDFLSFTLRVNPRFVETLTAHQPIRADLFGRREQGPFEGVTANAGATPWAA
jgi:hypothetical protein